MLRISQLHGFNARGKIPVKIEYIGTDGASFGGSSVSSPADFDLGQEAVSRYAIITYISQLDAIPTGITLEGVACTQQVTERNATADLSAEIWTVPKPTGTTNQSVVVTLNNGVNGSAKINVFTAYNVTDPIFAFDSGALAAFGETTLSWNLSVPVGGAVFGCASLTTGATMTWTGMDEVDETSFGESVAAREVPFVASPHAISVVKSSSFPPMVAAVLAVG